MEPQAWWVQAPAWALLSGVLFGIFKLLQMLGPFLIGLNKAIDGLSDSVALGTVKVQNALEDHGKKIAAQGADIAEIKEKGAEALVHVRQLVDRATKGGS